MIPPTCDLCRQPVVWAVTAANSRHIALDPDPDPDGNQAAYRDHTQTMRTRQLRAGEDPLAFERRYMPHVATCGAQRPAQAARLRANVIPFPRGRAPVRGRPPNRWRP